MLHLDVDGLAAAFRSHRRVFHLETRDDYTGVPGEADALRRFLSGEPNDPSTWAGPWFDLMREVTTRGISVQRVRVVTEPHSDYVRFALAAASANVDAGEDIRWLPRHLVDGITVDDWWLFDDELVAYTVFTSAGEALPGWVSTADPAIARHCAVVRDRLWPLSVSHRDYLT